MQYLIRPFNQVLYIILRRFLLLIMITQIPNCAEPLHQEKRLIIYHPLIFQNHR